ncbi:MAG TPA: TrkA family potassium uptake protein [Candidatus Aminicenantes bacterium]|nr:TrkA family potassium uptake protein [Candidatus Aminicenantes bacterium]
MNVVVVGGEKLVYFLTRIFISKGYHVAVINRDADECRRLAKALRARIILGDGSNPRILEEAGANAADALLAATHHDQDNLVICQLGVRKFHIPRTLALINDPENEPVFAALGVTSVFSATKILANLIEQKTGYESIVNLIPIEEGKLIVVETILEGTSPVLNRSLRDIRLPENSLIAGVLRSGQPIVPRGGTVLKLGDRLITICQPEDMGQVIKTLTG